MPLIHAELWKGSTREVKEAVAQSLTEAMVKHLGCPAQAVTIIFDEVDKKDWFIGAKSCQDLFPNPPAR